MNLEQSLQLLEEGLNIATRKGAFNMKEAKFLQDAFDVVKEAANANTGAKTAPEAKEPVKPAPTKQVKKQRVTSK